MARSNVIAQVNDVTRISQGTEIQGTLVSGSDIRIDGVFEGDLVTSGKMVLGEKAVIRGNIMCKSADIWGTIEGTFTVGDIVTFRSGSSFNGSLKTIRICIEMGADYTGDCTIIDEVEFKSISAEFIR